MNACFESTASIDGKRRLLDEPEDPMVYAEWYRPVFLHYRVDAAIIRRHLPDGFEVDEFDGSAWVTLVAITMKNFRPAGQGPWYRRLFPAIAQQRFFNVRTYVRYRGEPGLYFFWGWLSRPFGLPLPENPLGLTSSFGRLNYEIEGTRIALQVRTKAGCFDVSGEVTGPEYTAARGSFEEFALERYSGFYMHRGKVQVFRAWHPAWPIRPCVLKTSGTLPLPRVPWFEEARFAHAHYSEGFAEVWMGAPHAWEKPTAPHHHHRASNFFTLSLL